MKTILRSIRQDGFKQAWVKYRWKMIGVVFLFYIVRDGIIYILLPAYFISN